VEAVAWESMERREGQGVLRGGRCAACRRAANAPQPDTREWVRLGVMRDGTDG
jgi:hypothetical protein